MMDGSKLMYSTVYHTDVPDVHPAAMQVSPCLNSYMLKPTTAYHYMQLF